MFGRVLWQHTKRDAKEAKAQQRTSVERVMANRFSEIRIKEVKIKISPNYPAIIGQGEMDFANTTMLAATAMKARKETKALGLKTGKYHSLLRRS